MHVMFRIFETKRSLFRVSVCAIIALVFILTFALGFTLNDRGIRQTNKNAQELTGRMLIIDVEFVDLVTSPGAITLDWIIKGDEQSLCNDKNLSTCTDVMIFADLNLLEQMGSTTETTLSNNRPSQPIFYFNATAYAVKDLLNNSPIFRTTVTLTQYALDHHYPFDSYFAIAFFFAQEIQSNKSVAIKIGNIDGIVNGYSTTFDLEDEQNTVKIVFIVARGTLIKIYALIIVIAVWIISLVLLTLTIQSVLFRYPQKGEVLLAPIVTLFAFTSLRATMPGVPPFGAFIDYVAHLPCLGILVVSASLAAGIFIFRDPTHPDPTQAASSSTTITTQRYMDVLSAASDAIANEAVVVSCCDGSSDIQTRRAEAAAMKASAAAQRAIVSAYKTIDIAQQAFGPEYVKAQRQKVDNMSQKVTQQFWNRPTALQTVSIARDAAEAARDVTEASKDVADAVRDAALPTASTEGESSDIMPLVILAVQQYSDALDAAGDAYNCYSDAAAAAHKDYASEIQASTLKTIVATHRTIELAHKTIDAAEETSGSWIMREYREKVDGVAENLSRELQQIDPSKHQTAIQAADFARAAVNAARGAFKAILIEKEPNQSGSN